MISGIIFDYGGTIDSRGDHWSEVIYDNYLACGLDVSYQDFRQAYIEAERFLARNYVIRPEFDFRELMQHKIALEFRFLSRDLDGFCPEPNIIARVAGGCYDFARASVAEAKPLLDALAEEYPLCLVSNFYGNIGSVLRDFGLEGLFRGIVESAVIGIRKPDPRIFKVGCIVLDKPAEDVLVVGDSIDKDLIPAASIGCRCAWVEGRPWRGSEPRIPDNLPLIASGKLENIASALL